MKLEKKLKRSGRLELSFSTLPKDLNILIIKIKADAYEGGSSSP
ncbi:hypothetical protein TSIB_0257 [Thermococcus sibiricus MM 739]|uniref:Uncharacterized protein n=1 Tax=Thermococcus sibiricus (strain DSM 12597 / MM 739) TaxID=604354 RepID=C6A129_THESM|nr:hypothetical protein TSIB_0257 [Thermococcus sibiricus MM 739]